VERASEKGAVYPNKTTPARHEQHSLYPFLSIHFQIQPLPVPSSSSNPGILLPSKTQTQTQTQTQTEIIQFISTPLLLQLPKLSHSGRVATLRC